MLRVSRRTRVFGLLSVVGVVCSLLTASSSASSVTSSCSNVTHDAGPSVRSPAPAWPSGLASVDGGPALRALSTGAGVTVALVDTGIAPVPELNGAVWSAASRSFVPGVGVTDQDGHGTEMAAIVHEVAPRSRLLVLKALGGDGGTDAEVASAIRYGVSRGARIINLSAEGAAPEPAIRSAISYAGRHGALVVVAAGNDGIDSDTFPSYPAGYSLSNMVAVAATDGRGHLAVGSDWGSGRIALGALGVNVPTISLTGTPIEVSGTSPAAAITSGVAALVIARQPRISTAQLHRDLLTGVIREAGLAGRTSSGGQLDALRVLGDVTGDCRK